jgi:signal transduction histidine kinase
LRTPLIPLLALPDLLIEPDSLPSGTLNAYLRDVQRGGERLKDIGDDLIELLAPPGRDSFVWWPVSPEALLARLEAQGLAAARPAGITLARSALAAGTMVTDEARLLTALLRLVRNALAVTPAGGRVELSARDVAPGRVSFTVRDSGRGMTAQEIAIAKLPFHQLDMSASRRVNGMGLGLTLADRMAQRLGGQLVLDSRPGTGTAASIILPRKAGSGEPG